MDKYLNIVNEVLRAVGLRVLRAPSGDAIILVSVLTSAVIILGVEYLKKP